MILYLTLIKLGKLYMKPSLKFLDENLINKIISEAIHMLCTLGITIENKKILSLLADHDAKINYNTFHAVFTEKIVKDSITKCPESFSLFDQNSNESIVFNNNNAHFTPGSSALYYLDINGEKRKPVTKDYIQYVKINESLNNIASQSTAFIPSDVHEMISDSYRLFLSLLFGRKPVVTGTFHPESFKIMKDMQIVIRGNEKVLAEKPLTVFTCCPHSPLKWTNDSCLDIMNCASSNIPVEIVSAPIAGLVSPVTLTETLIQHTAENVSGIVIGQLINPGTPMLYGNATSVYDARYGTMSMGAIESMMLACASNEIGKALGLPTQAYIAVSDSLYNDAQNGLETGMGAVLGVLSGINNISGPGMLESLQSFSLAKLILDNDICGMAFRSAKGIIPKNDFQSNSVFRELIDKKQLLQSNHTRRYFRKEHYFPSQIINRLHSSQITENNPAISERIQNEKEKHLKSYQEIQLSEEKKDELITLMKNKAAFYGQDTIPTLKI